MGKVYMEAFKRKWRKEEGKDTIRENNMDEIRLREKENEGKS